MANRYRGQTSVEIAGKLCTVVFSWDGLAKLREAYGPRYEAEVTRICLDNDTNELARVLHIGLEAHHPELTVEKIKEASPGVIDVSNAVVNALNAAYYGPKGPPKEDVKDSENPPVSRMARRMSEIIFNKLVTLRSKPASGRTNSGG